MLVKINTPRVITFINDNNHTRLDGVAPLLAYYCLVAKRKGITVNLQCLRLQRCVEIRLRLHDSDYELARKIYFRWQSVLTHHGCSTEKTVKLLLCRYAYIRRNLCIVTEEVPVRNFVGQGFDLLLAACAR